MTIKVELVYNDGTKRELSFEKEIRVKGPRMLTAIDNALQKRTDLGDWSRWNLIDISA